MKLVVILLHCFFFLTAASCQTGNKATTNKQNIKNMETIYESKSADFTIKFQRLSDTLSTTWETIFTNKNGEELILEKDFVEKDSAWLHQETVNESPVDLYNITTSIVDDNFIYIVYNRFGEVYVVKYDWQKKEKINKEKKVIQKYLASGGFGLMKNDGELKKINNILYLYLHVGQSFSGVKSGLYIINTPNFAIAKINFNEEISPIKTTKIKQSAMQWMEQTESSIKEWEKMTAKEKEQNKDAKISDEELNNLKTLKKHSAEEFSYFHLPSDIDKCRDEETRLFNIGFETYSLFSTNTDFNNGSKYIQAVLVENKTVALNTNIIVVNYIKGKVYETGIKNGLDDDMIYFFYKDNPLGDVKIIRYNNHPMIGYWYIGNYKEASIAL